MNDLVIFTLRARYVTILPRAATLSPCRPSGPDAQTSRTLAGLVIPLS